MVRFFKDRNIPYRTEKIEEYIRNQLKEDLEYDKISSKGYMDLFTGELVIKINKR